MTPFRIGAFRRLWYSSVAGSAAIAIERTATAWLVLQIGGGALAVGAIFAARMLPSLLFGLAAGTIADRADRPRQLIAVGAAGLLLTAGFGGLVALGGLRVWQVLVFAFAAGCLQVFDTPARQALVLDTVPKDTALRALALTALAGRGAAALGSLAAGLLIAQLGLVPTYAAAAGAHALMALLAATLRVAQAHSAKGAQPPFREALRSAARLIVDVPVVRTLIAAGLACEVFAFSHLSAIPLFAQDVLAAGPEGLGTLSAASQVGGAVAVALLSLLPERGDRQPLLGAIFVAYGLAIVGLAATRSLALATAIVLLIGLCAGAFDVLQQTLIQMAVPDEQRGRAVGVWVLSIGSAPLGHLEMGALIAALGVPAALLINGGLTLAAALLLLARAPAYRWRLWARGS